MGIEQMQSGNLLNIYNVGCIEAFGKLFLKDIAACRIRARLEDRYDSFRRMLLPQRAQRFADCRGVMRKIIVYFYSATHFSHFCKRGREKIAFEFEPSFNTFERRERSLNFLVG